MVERPPRSFHRGPRGAERRGHFPKITEQGERGDRTPPLGSPQSRQEPLTPDAPGLGGGPRSLRSVVRCKSEVAAVFGPQPGLPMSLPSRSPQGDRLCSPRHPDLTGEGGGSFPRRQEQHSPHCPGHTVCLRHAKDFSGWVPRVTGPNF